MGTVGPPELLIVLGIVVLLFGARKLPELGSSVGKSIQNFKRGMAEAHAEEDEADATAANPEATGDSVRNSKPS